MPYESCSSRIKRVPLRLGFYAAIAAAATGSAVCQAANPKPSLSVALHAFHPAGTGQTDDIAAIQAAVDATAPGGTLTFEAGRKYAVSHPIDCRGKSIHINGANATVIMTGGNYPDNEAFHFGALLAGAPGVGESWNSQQPPPPTATFSGQLSAGQKTFACASTKGLRAGSIVSANLGTCPNDHTLPDVSFLARVTQASGGIVTLDTPIPRDVRGSTHSFYSVVSLGDNSSIRNIGLDWTQGVVADEQIVADYCRHFRAEGISGRISIAVTANYSRDVNVNGVKGELVLTSPAAGRVFGGWLTEDFHVSNVAVHQTQVSPVFFFEGNDRNGSLENVVINSDAPAAPWMIGALMLDGTENLAVNGLTINAPNGAQVVVASDGTSYGTNHRGLNVGQLKTNVPLAVGDMREIDSGALNNIGLGAPANLHYSVPVTGVSGRRIPLVRGVIRTLSIKVPQHVTAVYFRPDNAGPLVMNPKPGVWTTLVAGYSNSNWNDPTLAGVADCTVLDDGQLASDAQIEVKCDVFPCGLSMIDGSP